MWSNKELCDKKKISVDSTVKIMSICSAEHVARTQIIRGYIKNLRRQGSEKQERKAGDTDKR
jgi:hypothetical protein